MKQHVPQAQNHCSVNVNVYFSPMNVQKSSKLNFLFLTFFTDDVHKSGLHIGMSGY